MLTTAQERCTPARVPRAGFEPAAYRLGGGRSIRLSYRGMVGSGNLRGRAVEWVDSNEPILRGGRGAPRGRHDAGVGDRMGVHDHERGRTHHRP